MSSRNIKFVLTLAGAILITGCSHSSDSHRPVSPPPEQPLAEVVGYSATLHRTEGGFPHIIANDFGSLGFGTGYSVAQDNFCLMAKNVLRVRGQLSEYLGAGGGNLNSDLFRHYLVQVGIFDAEVSLEMEYMYAGYAAGYNHYLRQTGVDNIPDSDCRGASWVQHMTANDVRRAELTPAFLTQLTDLFIPAQPPISVIKVEKNRSEPEEGPVSSADEAVASSDVQRAPVPPRQPSDFSAEELIQLADAITKKATRSGYGSNGVGIGRDLSNHDGGLLYTNPHLDWSDLIFYMSPRHQIIPGVTNLLGATTYDRSLVQFGTNGDVAWTGTVSPSRTLSVYELDLVSGNPLAYMFDGKEEVLKQIKVTTSVLSDDGNLTERSHTFYESRHGLMLGLLFSWDMEKAFSLRIAAEGNRGQNGQSIALAQAKTVHDLLAASNMYAASGNTHTLGVDSNGEVLYGDLGPIANFTDEQLVICATDTPVLSSFFAPAFSGNTSACEWNTDPDSAAPGLLGASKHPSLIRTDYVTNSNNSYWLANPDAPISGIPDVVGDNETERTMRTRSGLRMVQQRIDGTDGLGGNTFDIDSLIDRMLSNQSHAGQLLRDGVVTLCENNPSVDLNGDTVDISVACPVLAEWDLHSNLESRGSHLFRELMRAASGGSTLPSTFNYTEPFNVEDPVNTPRGLDTTDNPAVLQALASAVKILNEAGIALNARLGDIQSVTKNEKVIPMHGGESFEGVFNKMTLDLADSKGYPAVTGSSGSWIMAVELTDSGTKAKGVLTFSMSSSSESPHYADMTEHFSNKELVDLPYALEDVEAAALSSVEISEGTVSCADGGWQTFQQPEFGDEDSCREHFVDIQANQLLDWVDT